MIKILVIVGTRPEAIKLAPLVKRLLLSALIEVRICSTGQHREMLDQVFDFFQIKVDYDLNLMKPNQSLCDLTAGIILQTSSVIRSYHPDWVLVQGDTTTAMAGALSAFYEKVKVAHVEAGLRSHNLYSPYPEEMNRLVISKIATCHFCPTQGALKNLLLEGITNQVYHVGNSIVDATLAGIEKIKSMDQGIFTNFFSGIDFSKKIILVTCHRRESFGDPFIEICKALVTLANTSAAYQVVYPVHLNPNIHGVAKKLLLHHGIKLLDPISYPQLLWLMSKSKIILTDSGGIQEEAPSFHKPVLVLRNVTERMEGIEAGTALLVGVQSEKIVEESIKLLEGASHYQSMIGHSNPYGDGLASQRMVQLLEQLS